MKTDYKMDQFLFKNNRFNSDFTVPMLFMVWHTESVAEVFKNSTKFHEILLSIKRIVKETVREKKRVFLSHLAEFSKI